MKRTFIEFPAFSRSVASGRIGDRRLRTLEQEIMEGGGVTIPGTGGLRKIRCGGRGRGKSGGLRIIFADYPQRAVTVLIVAFEKTVKEDLTRAEANELKRLKGELDRLMGV